MFGSLFSDNKANKNKDDEEIKKNTNSSKRSIRKSSSEGSFRPITSNPMTFTGAMDRFDEQFSASKTQSERKEAIKELFKCVPSGSL